MTKLKKYAFSALILLGATTATMANEYKVSFLALGSKSKANWFEEEVEDQDDPSIILEKSNYNDQPPQRLLVLKPNDNMASLNMVLNRPTPRVTLTSSKIILFEIVMGKEDIKRKMYAKTSIKKVAGSHTVLLTRRADAKTWEKPDVVSFLDSKDAFPMGALRLINTTDQKIFYKLNAEEAKLIPPTDKIIHTAILNRGEKHKIKLYTLNGKRKKYLLNTSLRSGKNKRINIACFFNKDKRKPIKATLFTTPK